MIEAYLSVIEDITATMSSAERFERLLASIRETIPCDAIALLKLQGDRLRQVASLGLGPGCAGRQFEINTQPRLARILSSRTLVQFESRCELPDPFDGLFGEGDGRLTTHDCMGASIYIDDHPWGLITFDAVNEGQFDHIDPATLNVAITFTKAIITAARRIQLLEEQLQHEHQVTAELNREATTHELIGNSSAMKSLTHEIETVAKTPLSILIEGETGVGKELVARQIHLISDRYDQALVHVNCAALPEQLAEAELFGHTKGAFTGASEARAGRIELADGGTLFLDEIGELPTSLQAKLLRFLQEGEIQRPGSDEIVKVDVRIIAATNRQLHEEVKKNQFRADLYHRISVFPIHVPPLRERADDILLLAEYFLERNQFRLKVDKLTLTHSAKAALKTYTWPGNVRELEHVLSRAALKANQAQEQGKILRITPDNLGLSNNIISEPFKEIKPSKEESFQPLREAIDNFQRQLIQQTLASSDGNLAATARKLGINRSNLSRLMKRLDFK